MKVAFEQGKSSQKEADIKGEGNLNLDGTAKPQGEGEDKKGNVMQVVEKLQGGNPNKFRFRRNKT